MLSFTAVALASVAWLAVMFAANPIISRTAATLNVSDGIHRNNNNEPTV